VNSVFDQSRNMASRPIRRLVVAMSFALDGPAGEASPRGIPDMAQVEHLHGMFKV
jgi:hypothetical protein